MNIAETSLNLLDAVLHKQSIVGIATEAVLGYGISTYFPELIIAYEGVKIAKDVYGAVKTTNEMIKENKNRVEHIKRSRDTSSDVYTKRTNKRLRRYMQDRGFDVPEEQHHMGHHGGSYKFRHAHIQTDGITNAHHGKTGSDPMRSTIDKLAHHEKAKDKANVGYEGSEHGIAAWAKSLVNIPPLTRKDESGTHLGRY